MRRKHTGCCYSWSPVDKLCTASVGRKSVAHSAFPQARAYFAHARLSPQSGSGRSLLLYGEPARPQFGSVCGADRHIARRGSPGAHPCTLPHRRLGCPPRSYALPMDFGLGTLPPGDAAFPGRWRTIKAAFVCLPPGESRSPIITSRGERGIWQRRYWEHDTRRSGLCGPHGLHAF